MNSMLTSYYNHRFPYSFAPNQSSQLLPNMLGATLTLIEPLWYPNSIALHHVTT